MRRTAASYADVIVLTGGKNFEFEWEMKLKPPTAFGGVEGRKKCQRLRCDD